jgi:hypothetical protein
MALILAATPAATVPTADEMIPFDVTLSVADTSETLFTVPAGKRLRSLSAANMGNGSTFLRLTPGTPATTGDFELEKRDAIAEQNLDLAEGTYAFIGSAGATPRVRGIAAVGPA